MEASPLTPHQGICPWTPLGAPPPDPRYTIARSRARHVLGRKPKNQTSPMMARLLHYTVYLIRLVAKFQIFTLGVTEC